ncbi:unnamed protein product [Rotaria sp. Silwood1]|nr:unnamed protein product [Rotaria sp. Silwood1]
MQHYSEMKNILSQLADELKNIREGNEFDEIKRTDDHPIKHYLPPLSLTNTDDLFIKAIRKDEDFGNIPRI